MQTLALGTLILPLLASVVAAQSTGPVAHYEFDGNTLDSSGHGHHGVMQGSPQPTFVAGRFGQGLQFPGLIGSHVEVPASSLLAPTGAVTFACWFKVHRFPTWHSSLIYKAGATPTGQGFADRSYTLWVTETTQGGNFHMTATAVGSGQQTRCDPPGSRYGLGEWMHVAGVVDANARAMRIYVDAVLFHQCSFSGPTILAGGFPLRIGGPFQTAGDQSALDGVLDDLRIYDRALSAPEIRDLLLPIGVTRFGASSPGCRGGLAMSVTSPPRLGNAGFGISCTQAPSNATGGLAFAATSLVQPLRILGADLWVDPRSAFFVVAVSRSSAQGTANDPLPIPNDPTLAGAGLAMQYVWLGPTAPPPCPALGISASGGLAITIQR